MAEAVTLRSEIGVASFTRADDQRDAFRNVDPLSHQLGDLVGIVREQVPLERHRTTLVWSDVR